MKTVNNFLAVSAAIIFIGCASNPPPAPKAQPHLGMTKQEVEDAYGKPGTIVQSPSGETWQYDNYREAAIPFNFGFKPKWQIFTFGPDGRVINFNVRDK